MSKPVKIGPVAVALLTMAAGALEEAPTADGPLEYVIEAIDQLCRGLADAGAPDSDGGRALTEGELRSVLASLARDVDYAAAHVPDDAIEIAIPSWTRVGMSAIGLLLGGVEGPVGQVAHVVAALGSAAGDGVIDAAELRAILASLRAVGAS